MSKCKAPGHDEAIKIWGMCRVCGKTKEGDDMENWRQEYEDAIAERNGLIQQLAEKDIYIHQLRGALGYTVPGSICENPDILNGIADALQRQLAEKDERIIHLESKLCLEANAHGEILKQLAESRKEVDVSNKTNADDANAKIGDRYGVDWVYNEKWPKASDEREYWELEAANAGLRKEVERFEANYQKIIKEILQVSPIPACDRKYGIEPPWEVISRVREQLEQSDRDKETWKKTAEDALQDYKDLKAKLEAAEARLKRTFERLQK